MITQLDFYILNLIQNMRTLLLDFLMPFITYLGSGGAVWIATAVIMLFFRKSRKSGIDVLLALLIGLLLSTMLLKGLVGRIRPFNMEEGLLNASTLLIGVPSGEFSFPSGHAVSSFSAAVVLFMYNRKIGVPALVLAVLIAFSRLYLYVHFPTDVIGGAVVGIAIAVLTVYITRKIGDRINERKLSDNTEQEN